MKATFRLFFLLSILLSFYCIACNDVLSVADKPDFSDNGKAVDSLKKVYNCENVSYYNWGEKKPVDSCLTVCFINSNYVPFMDNIDTTVAQIKAMASAINKSLQSPQNYKSINIVFLKGDSGMGQKVYIPSGGIEVSRAEL